MGLVGLIGSLSIIFGDKKCKQAIKLEKENKFKEACEYYAIAILNGSMRSKFCREKVKEIWSKHEPFDYCDKLEGIKAQDQESKCNCGEAGFYATMGIIEEITGKDKT